MRESQEWIWREFRCVLPADWEMLQFSRHGDRGRCAFADRYLFRFELDWRVVPAEPEMARMMSDYRAKLTTDGSLTEPNNVQLPGWHGVTVIRVPRRALVTSPMRTGHHRRPARAEQT